MFFYIFIKIIVCHFIYIFAKWVILFLWHAVLHIMDMIFLENMNIIYILFAKYCPQYIRFYGCLQSYFCSVLQKSTFTIILRMCFSTISFEIYVLSILYPPPKKKKSENRKAWGSLIQYYLWAPLWILFWSKKWR